MDDVTQPGIHWMQPFVTEMVALRLTPETEIMNPMVCTTRDGVRNVFRDVQVSFFDAFIFNEEKIVQTGNYVF